MGLEKGLAIIEAFGISKGPLTLTHAAEITGHTKAAVGRSLLTLDTRTGDHAEPLYAALGYRIAGIIPGYCRDPFESKLDPTTVMYKTL